MSAHLLNTIKANILFLLKILLGSWTSFLHLPYWASSRSPLWGLLVNTAPLPSGPLRVLFSAGSLPSRCSPHPLPSTVNYCLAFKLYLQYYFLMETFPGLHHPLVLSQVSVLSFHRILLPSFKGLS